MTPGNVSGAKRVAPQSILNPDARRVCTLSGVQAKLTQEKLVTLRDLERSLEVSLRDASAAIASEAFWRHALLATKVVKLLCDVTVGLLGESKATGIAGQAVSIVYDRATFVIDALHDAPSGAELTQVVVENHVDAGAKVLEGVGREASAKAIGASKVMLKAAQSAFEIYGEAASGAGGRGLESAKRTVLAQLQQVRIKTQEANSALAACGLE